MAEAKSRRTPPEIPEISRLNWNNARGAVHRALRYLSKDAFNSLPAEHASTHLQGAVDALQAPGTPTQIDPNLGADPGDGPTYALEDHRHSIDLKLTTKGDLLTRDGTGYTRLPVGTDNQQLFADSTAATGLRWASAPSGQLSAADLEYLTWVL